jgi:hypothetical protein
MPGSREPKRGLGRFRKPGPIGLGESISTTIDRVGIPDVPLPNAPLNQLWDPYRDDHAIDKQTGNGIPWLLVPYGLAADIVLRHSGRYTVHAADKKVTVQKLGFRSYRVFGNILGRTYLKAVNDSTGDAEAFLEVSVKPTWFRKIAFYFLSDDVHRTMRPRHLGSLKELVRKMNDILHPQVAVKFVNLEIHNKFDVKLAGNFGERVGDDIFLNLVDDISPGAHFHVFFVWAIGGSWPEAHAVTTMTNTHEGLCIYDDAVPDEDAAKVLAHEAVHFLLYFWRYPEDKHHSPSLGDLMYPRTGFAEFSAGTRIGRLRSDIINRWDVSNTSIP